LINIVLTWSLVGVDHLTREPNKFGKRFPIGRFVALIVHALRAICTLPRVSHAAVKKMHNGRGTSAGAYRLRRLGASAGIC
jgi:hypothetical protein